MSEQPQERDFLEMLLGNLPAGVRGALVILVDDEGHIESADSNLGMENSMLVAFSLAHAIAQQVKAERNAPSVSANGHQPAIYLPPDIMRKLRDL